jgi:hypothetical protein
VSKTAASLLHIIPAKQTRKAIIPARVIAAPHRKQFTPHFEINTYVPGIRIKTSPTDFFPIEQVQMMRFTGEKWQLFGPIIDGHAE